MGAKSRSPVVALGWNTSYRAPVSHGIADCNVIFPSLARSDWARGEDRTQIPILCEWLSTSSNQRSGLAADVAGSRSSIWYLKRDGWARLDGPTESGILNLPVLRTPKRGGVCPPC